jgi:hypothetical protein
MKMIPDSFKAYRCADYFNSNEMMGGVWDATAFLWLILPAGEVTERVDIHFLVIGRPGVDGIEFGYRAGHDGIWAYFPIGNDFRLLAPTVTAFLQGWRLNEITV